MWFQNMSESKWALADYYHSETPFLLLPNYLKLFLCHAVVFCTSLIQKRINAVGSRKHFKLGILFIPLLYSFSVMVELFHEKFWKISANCKTEVWKFQTNGWSLTSSEEAERQDFQRKLWDSTRGLISLPL